jgi:hypothetical protein
MQYLLACGHQQFSAGWPSDTMRCDDHHHHIQRVVAIECREWHVKCDVCKFGRWFGQDKAMANVMANKHKHPCRVGFDLYEPYRYRVRREYGRRVKIFIVQPNAFNGARRYDQPVLQMLSKVIGPDIPHSKERE